jgi:hypothetical protein
MPHKNLAFSACGTLKTENRGDNRSISREFLKERRTFAASEPMSASPRQLVECRSGLRYLVALLRHLVPSIMACLFESLDESADSLYGNLYANVQETVGCQSV